MTTTSLPTRFCPGCNKRLVSREWEQHHVATYMGPDSTRVFIERECLDCEWSIIATLTSRTELGARARHPSAQSGGQEEANKKR